MILWMGAGLERESFCLWEWERMDQEEGDERVYWEAGEAVGSGTDVIFNEGKQGHDGELPFYRSMRMMN